MLVGILGLVQGGIEIGTFVLLALDLVATGWGAVNAPRVPVGESRRQAQAV